MLFPSVNNQKRWLTFLLVACVVANIYFDFSFQGTLEERSKWIDDYFGRALFPVQWVMSKTRDASTSGAATVVDLWHAREENEVLKKELSQQTIKIQQMEADQIELQRLRDALGFKSDSKLSLIPARVMGRDISLFLRTLEIDHGAKANIILGMPVVCPQGVVGKIVRVSDDSSTVLLVTDVNSRVDAVVERSRSRVIVAGSSEGSLTLRYLPRRFDLRQGDELVTSGFGGFFPEGFKLGIVVGMAQDPHFVLDQAELEPAVNFDSLEEVFVVRTLAKWP